MTLAFRTLLLGLLGSCVGLPAVAAPAEQRFTPRSANGLATTPPMGWNSWNKFGCNVDEATIRRQADALVSSGMQYSGYVYVIIDDCWQGQRGPDGNISPDTTRFPSGIRALADPSYCVT